MSKSKTANNDWIASFLKADQSPTFPVSNNCLIPSNSEISIKNHLPDFTPIQNFDRNNQDKNNTQGFNPGHHLLQGWSGNSLSSKAGVKLMNFFEKVENELMQFFIMPNSLNKSLKIGIHNEFLLFAQSRAINLVNIDNYQNFWVEVKKTDSPYRDLLDKFIRKYTSRVAAVYFFKIRFIVAISSELKIEINSSVINNPNSFLKKIFRENSSTAIEAKSLGANIYSWFRPSEAVLPTIEQFINLTRDLSFNEIIKLISAKTRIVSPEDNIYSHSISHKHFGLFVNSLLINFPIWKAKINNNKFITPNKFESLSTKFKGDFLESLSVSHWLAQYNNKNIPWHHVICPDFEENDKSPTDFVKIHNELQFLTLLAEIAKDQGQDSVKFICDIFNQNNKKKIDNTSIQKSLFSNNETILDPKYDRVVVNICKFPKNNPTHYLINQILEESKCLRSDGYLYVLSDKKLFVPSQKDKLNNLLNELRIECIINLEDVKGKGEIANYIYIFSKNSSNKILYNFEKEKKNTCLSFRVDADLNCFNDFSDITDHFQHFYRSHLNEAPSMYEKTYKKNNVQFYLDAIVDGRLIHSSGEDSNNITHPQFFNNLLNKCVAFDSLFDIKTINDEDYSHNLYINSDKHRKQIDGDFIIIIDRRNDPEINLEIIKANSYKGISYQYGFTQCEYFSIKPKYNDLNLNLFKEYFSSKIGKQIISLQFLGRTSKLKSKLSTLLIPKIFVNNVSMPDHILHGFKLFSLGENEILSIGLNKVSTEYSSIHSLLKSLVDKYPKNCLSILTQFKNTLNSINESLDSGKVENINFANMGIISAISKLKTYPLFPKNKNVYINFQVDSQEELSSSLEEIKLIENETDSELQLISRSKNIVSLHSGKLFLQFLSFLMVSQRGKSISLLLQSIQLPNEEQLESVISEFLTQKNEIDHLLGNVERDIERFFIQITSH